LGERWLAEERSETREEKKLGEEDDEAEEGGEEGGGCWKLGPVKGEGGVSHVLVLLTQVSQEGKFVSAASGLGGGAGGDGGVGEGAVEADCQLGVGGGGRRRGERGRRSVGDGVVRCTRSGSLPLVSSVCCVDVMLGWAGRS